ncbi:hypothetical protein QEG73_00630 [Chitinophagaceae bacterium 26-R-25]|nr:hypothetical protein [Chitinophagaceae bacterium 26-R-25]
MTKQVLIVLTTLLFFGCQKKSDTNTSNEKPTTEEIKLVGTYGNFYLYVNGKNITVNWGDGTPEETFSKTYTGLLLSHTILEYKIDTIVIRGESITSLNCSSNKIRDLNVSGNPSLTSLNCYDNVLTQLDLSKNSALKFVNCQANNFSNSGLDSLFKTLHVNTTKDADSIVFHMNPGTWTCDPTIAIKRGWNANNSSFLDGKNELATFITNNRTQVQLALRGDNISVDWGDGKYETFNKLTEGTMVKHDFPRVGVYPVKLGGDNITYLYCMNVDGSNLDVTKLPNLTYLDCSENHLRSLDVSKNAKLTFLNCGDDELSSLDLSNNKELTYVDCSSSNGYMINRFYSIDFSNNPVLKHLDCGGSRVINLNVSKNTALTYLDCQSNYDFTTLNISNNVQLDTLYCNNTGLSSLDVSHNTALKYLNCYYSNLTTINISNNPALTFIDAHDNNIQKIDATGSPSLVNLNCANNVLTSLIVSENKSLQTLACFSNQLDTLSLLHANSLLTFDCSYNKLTALDLTNCVQLQVVRCNTNNLSAAALNNLFSSLHPMVPPATGSIYALYNPGGGGCDQTIATKKGWYPAY